MAFLGVLPISLFSLSHWARENNNTLLERAWCFSQILSSHFRLSHSLIPQASPQLGVRLFWLGVVLAQLVPPAVNSSALVISAAALGLSKANSVKKGRDSLCLMFKLQICFPETLQIDSFGYILRTHSTTQWTINSCCCYHLKKAKLCAVKLGDHKYSVIPKTTMELLYL